MEIPASLIGIDPIDITMITQQNFQESFKLLSKNNASSPSGRHLTHYKVLAQDDRISFLPAFMITLPFQLGFAPSRWQCAIQIMLEKDPDFPLTISRLRVIQLLEADMNLAFRLLWGHRLVYHALDHGALTKWNFGNLPGASCLSAILLKVISYDYIRFRRTTAVIFNNDAKACYDRIIPSLGMIMSTKRLGMPKSAATCMLAIILAMHFYVRTAYRVLSTYYSTSDTLLILGVLQGSGAASCIWMCLSNVLLDALSKLADGFFACYPHGHRHSQPLGEAFVDDKDLWRTSDTLTGPALVDSMQTVAQHWERLLFASRGALALQKCFFYLMDWAWDRHGCPSLSPNSTSPNLTLQMTSGQSPILNTIPRVESNTARRSISVCVAPNGTFDQEFHHRLTQSRKWALNISKAPLTRTEVHIAFFAMWSPAIHYPLAVTSLTKAQCTQLQTAYIGTFLSKIGIVRTTAHPLIIFGPSYHSGLDLPELRPTQGTLHISFLLGHLCAADAVGNLIRITIDTLQLHLGSPQPPMSYLIHW